MPSCSCRNLYFFQWLYRDYSGNTTQETRKQTSKNSSVNFLKSEFVETLQLDKESSLKSRAFSQVLSYELMNFFRNICSSLFVVAVQNPSHFLLIVTPRTAACQASLSLTICQGLPKFMSIESVMPSNFSSATLVPLQLLFTFCHSSGIICISELVDISPSSLNSSL